MKKLFSALFIVMMIALACTVVASAAEVYSPDSDGLYNIEYAVTAEDGTQFGMVVIEATGDEAFALDEATIRYIDQVGAEDNAIAFDAFAPMDLKNAGTYKVYIGGGDLDEATFIGTLGAATEPDPTPTVKSVTIDQAAPTVEEGKTVALTATVVDADAEYTLAWTSDATGVATVDAATGVVTGVKAGTANITVTAAEGVTATVAVTVTAAPAEGDRMPGDADENGRITARDATRILQVVAKQPGVTINESNADVDGNGRITARDATRILQVVAKQPGIELQ